MRKAIHLFSLAFVLAGSVASVLIGTSTGTFAQTSYTGRPVSEVPTDLSLEDAIRLAVQRNYTTTITGNEVERARLEEARSRAALLPSVSASAGYGYDYSLRSLDARTTTIQNPIPGEPDRVIVQAPGAHSLRYDLGASLNLFNGGADRARIRAAQSNLTAAERDFDWTRQEIAYNVTSAYLNALRSRELVQSSQQTLAEARGTLTRLRGLFEAGSIPIAQVYQQEAVVGQNELSLIQAQNNYENAKADVLYILDVPPNAYDRYSLTLAGLDTSTGALRRAQIDTSISDSHIQATIDARPDIAAEHARIEALRSNIDVLRAGLLPRLDANAGVGGNGANSDLTKTQMRNALSGGLSLQIPIYDRSQTRYSIEEQEVTITNEEVRLRQQEQQIRSDVAKAVNNLRSADQAIDASARALRAAEESLRLAQERLRVGAGIQLDVVVAQAQLETARTNRVNAIFNYVLAQKQIQYTLGEWRY